jgi:tRNA(adenine34) deaminase
MDTEPSVRFTISAGLPYAKRAEWELVGVIGDGAEPMAVLRNTIALTVGTLRGAAFDTRWSALGIHNRKCRFAFVVRSPSACDHVVAFTLRNRGFWGVGLVTPGSNKSVHHGALVDLSAGFDPAVSLVCGDAGPPSGQVKDAPAREFFRVVDCAASSCSLVVLVRPQRARPHTAFVTHKVVASWRVLDLDGGLPRRSLVAATFHTANTVRITLAWMSPGTAASQPVDKAAALQQFDREEAVTSDEADPVTPVPWARLAVTHHVVELTDADSPRVISVTSLVSRCWAAGGAAVDALCHLPGDDGGVAVCVDMSHMCVVSATGTAIVHELPFPGGSSQLSCVDTRDGLVAAVMDQRTGVTYFASCRSAESVGRIDTRAFLCPDATGAGMTFRIASSQDGVVGVSSGVQYAQIRLDGALPRPAAASGINRLIARVPTVAPIVPPLEPGRSWLASWAEASQHRRVAHDAGRAALIARFMAENDPVRAAWVADEAGPVLSTEARAMALPLSTEADALLDPGLPLHEALMRKLRPALEVRQRANRRFEVSAVSSDALQVALIACRVAVGAFLGTRVSVAGSTTAFGDGHAALTVRPQAVTDDDRDYAAPVLIDALALGGDIGYAALVAVLSDRAGLLPQLLAGPHTADLVEAAGALDSWFTAVAQASQDGAWVDRRSSHTAALASIDEATLPVLPEKRPAVKALCIIARLVANDPSLVTQVRHSPFRSAVLSLAAWLWAVRIFRCFIRSNGEPFDHDGGEELEAAKHWWAAAAQCIDMTQVFGVYAAMVGYPGAPDAAASSDGVLAALCLRAVGLASFLHDVCRRWRAVADGEPGSEAELERLRADLKALVEHGAGIICRTTTLQNMVITMVDLQPENAATSPAELQMWRDLLRVTVGQDTDNHEKRRYHALSASISDAALMSTNVITPPGIARFAVQLAAAELRRMFPALNEMDGASNDWRLGAVPLEATDAYWVYLRSRQWLSPQPGALTSAASPLSAAPSHQQLLYDAVAAALLKEPQEQLPAVSERAGQAASARGSTTATARAEVTARPRTAGIAAKGAVGGLPVAESARPASPIAPRPPSDLHFRESEVAWWEDAEPRVTVTVGGDVAANALRHAAAVDDATTVTTATSARDEPRATAAVRDFDHGDAARHERRRRHRAMQHAHSTSSSASEPVVNSGSRLTKAHLAAVPTAVVGRSVPPLLASHAAAMHPLASLQYVPPSIPQLLSLNAPRAQRGDALPQYVAGGGMSAAAPVATKQVALPTLLQLPTTPAGATGFAPRVLAMPPPEGTSAPPQAHAASMHAAQQLQPVAVSAPQGVPAGSVPQSPMLPTVAPAAHAAPPPPPSGPPPQFTAPNAAPNAAPSAGPMVPEDRCRAADALADEYPLPSTVMVLRDDSGRPHMVTTRPGVTVSAVPILDVAQEAAFGRYVQHLLTSALLGTQTPLKDEDIAGKRAAHPPKAAHRPVATDAAQLQPASAPQQQGTVQQELAPQQVHAATAVSDAAVQAATVRTVALQSSLSMSQAFERSPVIPSTAAYHPPSGLSPVEQAVLVQREMEQRGSIRRLEAEVERLRTTEVALRTDSVRQLVEVSGLQAAAQAQAAHEQAPRLHGPLVETATSPMHSTSVARVTTAVLAKPTAEPVMTQTEPVIIAGASSQPVLSQPWQQLTAAAFATIDQQVKLTVPTAGEARAAALLADLNASNAKIAETLRLADQFDTAIARSYHLLNEQPHTSAGSAVAQLQRDSELARDRAAARAAALTAAVHAPPGAVHWRHGTWQPGPSPDAASLSTLSSPLKRQPSAEAILTRQSTRFTAASLAPTHSVHFAPTQPAQPGQALPHAFEAVTISTVPGESAPAPSQRSPPPLSLALPFESSITTPIVPWAAAHHAAFHPDASGASAALLHSSPGLPPRRAGPLVDATNKVHTARAKTPTSSKHVPAGLSMYSRQPSPKAQSATLAATLPTASSSKHAPEHHPVASRSASPLHAAKLAMFEDRLRGATHGGAPKHGGTTQTRPASKSPRPTPQSARRMGDRLSAFDKLLSAAQPTQSRPATASH